MKNTKSLIIIGVIFLNVLAILMVGQSIFGKSGSYEQHISQAREYAKQELCFNSIEEYNEAIAKKDTAEIRLEMIDVYKKGLETGEFTNTYDIVNSLTEAINAHQKEPKVYEAACKLLTGYGKYEDCAKILMQARDLNVSSDAIEKYREEVRYKYTKNFSMYTEVSPMYDDIYTVATESGYSFLNNEATQSIKGEFKYASSFANGYAFAQTESAEGEIRSFVINQKGERQIYIKDVEKSSGVGLGKDKQKKDLYLLACKVGDKYKYYGMDGKELFGDYKFAGRVRNNIAAVEEKEGSWKLIDATGKPVIDKTFSDVVLNEFDECAPRGLIFAKEGKKYQLYNQKMEKVGKFECDGAKAFVDEYAAFKSGELWGFVDKEGKVVIEPQFEDAKSFSNGMGAVYSAGSWKFINTKGEIVIDEEAYEDVSYLGDSGICFVKTKGYWSYLKFYYTGK